MSTVQKKINVAPISRQTVRQRLIERDGALLDTASQLFFEPGFAQVSIEQVSRQFALDTLSFLPLASISQHVTLLDLPEPVARFPQWTGKTMSQSSIG